VEPSKPVATTLEKKRALSRLHSVTKLEYDLRVGCVRLP
jgi:hypothetical protein